MSSFRSKRLRVQLPCGEGPTLVEAEAAEFIQCTSFATYHCTMLGTETYCQLFATHCTWWMTQHHVMAESAESVQLDPEQLPLFREALKMRLAQAERTQRQLEAQLQDVDEAERQLREREDES